MTDNIKLPPYPEGLCLREDIEDYAREAVRLNATMPEISTKHGPWVESTLHEGETYCKRCLVRSVFASQKKCEPHVSAPAAPAAQAVPEGWPPGPTLKGVTREMTADDIAMGAAAPQPAAQQGDARVTLPDDIERMAVNRYRPVPSGVLAYKVVGGEGDRILFFGTKGECQSVARELTEAFLDGAHVALAAQAQEAAPAAWGEPSDPLQGAANWLLEAIGGCNIRTLEWHLMIDFNRAERLMLAARAAQQKGAKND